MAESNVLQSTRVMFSRISLVKIIPIVDAVFVKPIQIDIFLIYNMFD